MVTLVNLSWICNGKWCHYIFLCHQCPCMQHYISMLASPPRDTKYWHIPQTLAYFASLPLFLVFLSFPLHLFYPLSFPSSIYYSFFSFSFHSSPSITTFLSVFYRRLCASNFFSHFHSFFFSPSITPFFSFFYCPLCASIFFLHSHSFLLHLLLLPFLLLSSFMC